MPERQGSGVTAEEIITKVLEAMRENCEEFHDHKRAPAIFHVYLGKEDYERIQGILDEIEEDAERMLDQELARLNQEAHSFASDMRSGGELRRLVDSVLDITGLSEPRRKPKIYKPPKNGWSIRFNKVPGGGPGQNEFEVHVELEKAGREKLKGGNLTKAGPAKRGRKVQSDLGAAESSARGFETGSQMTVSSRVFARIRYRDGQDEHTFEMKTQSIVIGRGGTGHQVHLRLDTQLDVSREHLVIRRDQSSGRFFLKDISRLGSTINGLPVPGSLEIVDGIQQDRNQEVELPPRARIGLAGVTDLVFEVAEAS